MKSLIKHISYQYINGVYNFKKKPNHLQVNLDLYFSLFVFEEKRPVTSSNVE